MQDHFRVLLFTLSSYGHSDMIMDMLQRHTVKIA